MEIRIQSKCKKITTFVFDIDGVFTDGTIQVGENDILRTFSVRDGYAIQIAAKSGYRMAVISGGRQESIRKRLEGLGIQDIFLGVGTKDKPQVFEQLIAKYQIMEEEVLYIGDDIPDLLVMQDKAVFSCCPADAVEEVRRQADYISPINGGKGVVRDIIELVMKSQKKWLKVF